MDPDACKCVLKKLKWKTLIPFESNDSDTSSLVDYSIFEDMSSEEISELDEKYSLQSDEMSKIDKAKGCLVGLAVGDSVGAPMEFKNAVSTGQIPNGEFFFHHQCTSSSFNESHNFDWIKRFRWNMSGKQKGSSKKKKAKSSDNIPIELHYKYPTLNKFFLKPGQFTDDTSMALCLADSLIYSTSKYLMNSTNAGSLNEDINISNRQNMNATDQSSFENDTLQIVLQKEEPDSFPHSNQKMQFYDGKDLRFRFFSWWNQGYNNCFRFDTERPTRCSVGLGGNIASSLRQIKKAKSKTEISPKYEKSSDDAGNGSLMRLAPVAIRFCNNLELALEVAKDQSEATHPGSLASEACHFLCYILVNAINNNHQSCEEIDRQNIKVFLDSVVLQYLNKFTETLSAKFIRLIKADESSTSLEENWNWRSKRLPLSEICERRLKADRTYKYNGYPVIPGYFGAFAPDGLAIALFSAYNTTTFDDAIQLCVDHLGDADTTAAICGQICGAFYGLQSINPKFRHNLSIWDRNETAFRALLLFSLQNL